MRANVHDNDRVNIKLLYICNLQCHYLTRVVSFSQGSQIAQPQASGLNQINLGLRPDRP